MSAELLIELTRDQQTLVAVRHSEKLRPERRNRLAEPGAHAEGFIAQPETGRRPGFLPGATCTLDKGLRFVMPAAFEKRFRA